MAREPFSPQFNVWWVLSAALVAIVLLGGIAIGVFVGRGQSEPDQAAEQTPSSAGTTGANPGGVCNVPADDQDYPLEAPETKWELYQNVVSVPTSDEYGPLKREGAFWQCYARSPKGALFAAFNLSQAFTLGDVYDAAVDSPGAKELFAQQAEVPKQDRTILEVSGFQIVNYDTNQATVSLLMTNSGTEGTVDIPLIWDETAGDWRWDAANTTPPAPAEDTSGYIPWGPRNG